MVCANLEEAERALDECLGELRFGQAGRHVVVEEMLNGPEVSVWERSERGAKCPHLGAGP